MKKIKYSYITPEDFSDLLQDILDSVGPNPGTCVSEKKNWHYLHKENLRLDLKKKHIKIDWPGKKLTTLS